MNLLIESKSNRSIEALPVEFRTMKAAKTGIIKNKMLQEMCQDYKKNCFNLIYTVSCFYHNGLQNV